MEGHPFPLPREIEAKVEPYVRQLEVLGDYVVLDGNSWIPATLTGLEGISAKLEGIADMLSIIPSSPNMAESISQTARIALEREIHACDALYEWSQLTMGYDPIVRKMVLETPEVTPLSNVTPLSDAASR